MIPMAFAASATPSASDAVTSALSVVTSVISFVMANPILVIPIGAALVGVGLKVFQKARSTSGVR